MGFIQIFVYGHIWPMQHRTQLDSDLDLVLNSDMVLDLASRTKTKTMKIWSCTSLRPNFHGLGVFRTTWTQSTFRLWLENQNYSHDNFVLDSAKTMKIWSWLRLKFKSKTIFSWYWSCRSVCSQFWLGLDSLLVSVLTQMSWSRLQL